MIKNIFDFFSKTLKKKTFFQHLNHSPELLGLPKESNQEAPRRMMVGETATVSTLVTVVGQPYNPHWAGKGGFNLGLPCLPSKLSIKPEQKKTKKKEENKRKKEKKKIIQEK